MEGRDFVLPEDVQAVLPGVAGHRLHAAGHEKNGDDDVEVLLKSVAVP